jgi:hypothetical protein
LDRASADIIGKKAGRIIIGLGLKELKRGGTDYNGVFTLYQALAHEILNKTLATVHFLTIPEDMFPQAPSQVVALNDLIRGLAAKDDKRVRIMDYAAYVADFKDKQLQRGKFGRSLYTDEGLPTSICNTFLSLFLYDFIKIELK